jgi:hypothetical protein
VFVGSSRVTLRLPENASLKGKRQLVRSLSQRLRNKFSVAVAEVDSQDRWQIATIGIVCVSNDARHARAMLDGVIDYIAASRLDAELLESEVEVSRAF